MDNQPIETLEFKEPKKEQPVFRTKLELIVDLQIGSEQEARALSEKYMKLALEEWQSFKNFTTKPEIEIGEIVTYKMGVLQNVP